MQTSLEDPRFIEAMPGAAPVRDVGGGTPLMTDRDGRFACVSGEALLTRVRLSADAATRRLVAACCNSAMFLKSAPGFWVSAYRAHFDPAELPTMEMRIHMKDWIADAPPPPGARCCAAHPLRLFMRGATARLAMITGG